MNERCHGVRDFGAVRSVHPHCGSREALVLLFEDDLCCISAPASQMPKRPVAVTTSDWQPGSTAKTRRETLDFDLLCLIEREPGLSQREISERLGISLGRTNYCLKALLAKGVVKLANFRASNNKLGYVYVLTPSGLSERVALSGRFLQRKLAEYDRLKRQIAQLDPAHLSDDPG